MFKIRVALIGALALLAVGGITASAASAAGPYWRVAGSRLEAGTKQMKLWNKNKVTIKTRINTTNITIECKTSLSEGWTIEGNGTGQGQDKGRLAFQQCKTNLTECPVAEPFTTVNTKSFLAIATGTNAGKIVDVIEPGIGTTFAVFMLKGAGCNMPGPWTIKGNIAALVKTEEAELVEGELEFPAAPIPGFKHETGAEQKLELAQGTNVVEFNVTYGTRLVSEQQFGAFKT